jgi:hypothetical protein
MVQKEEFAISVLYALPNMYGYRSHFWFRFAGMNGHKLTRIIALTATNR